jgi:hypothetical protein
LKRPCRIAPPCTEQPLLPPLLALLNPLAVAPACDDEPPVAPSTTTSSSTSRRRTPSGRAIYRRSAWVTQQLRNATPLGVAPRFLLLDHDNKFGVAFDALALAAGIRVIRTAVRAPDMNAVCERFLGSLRRECLDHVLVTRRPALPTRRRRVRPLPQRRTPSPRAPPADPGACGAPRRREDHHLAGPRRTPSRLPTSRVTGRAFGRIGEVAGTARSGCLGSPQRSAERRESSLSVRIARSSLKCLRPWFSRTPFTPRWARPARSAVDAYEAPQLGILPPFPQREVCALAARGDGRGKRPGVRCAKLQSIINH